jgi:hypothetical protein
MLPDGSLDKLMALKPSTYNYNSLTGYDQATLDRTITGFIAQDLVTVFPEMVGTTMIDGKEYYDTNISALPLYIVKGMQEQQGLIGGISDRVSMLDLQTDQSVSTLGELQASVSADFLAITGTLADLDTRLTEIDDPLTGKLTTIDSRILSLENTVGLSESALSHETRIARLESDMTMLRDEHLTLMEFFATFNLDRVVIADADGNIDLLDGKLVAKAVATGGIEIEVRDPEAPTIGTAVLYPVAKDDDLDLNDDYTGISMDDLVVSGRDGKTVSIDTTAVSEKSLIYVTPVGSTGNRVLFVGSVRDGEGFSVGMDEPATESIRFNWWIVGKNEFPSVEEDASETDSTDTEDADGTEESASDEPAV